MMNHDNERTSGQQAGDLSPEAGPPIAEQPAGTAPDVATVRAAASAEVEELEITIRNHEAAASDQRDLATELVRLIRANLERLTSLPAIERTVQLVRENVNSDYLDPDFWKGVGMVLRYQIDETRSLVERRLRGDYTTDAYGMDADVVELLRPFAAFFYRTWWRVTAEGVEHVPEAGATLLVANHSVMVPWDSAMIATAVLEEHVEPRLVRALHDPWYARAPGFAPLLAAVGQVPALPENVDRLLADHQLVAAFPEGTRGLTRLYRDRYQLAPFEHASYVPAALRAAAPIVPTAVIGAAESYPMLANVQSLAQLLGLPYFPVTPFFPWFGLFGMLPLPTKWTIVFHEPIDTAAYGAESAGDLKLVSELHDQLRSTIQATLTERSSRRRSVFFG